MIIDWFNKNEMIVISNKFLVIITDRKKEDHTNENIVINNKQIKSVASVEILGI